ncbi:MAG: hypothetical protein KC680_03995, partial [Candidatus Peregrinibacteria bacterium]|nr:hypothetical protein [Candidatus Peregrinibacteria bacterium]
LMQVWGDSSYRGGTISLGEGECVVTIIPEDDIKIVSIHAHIGKWEQTLQARVDSESIGMQLLEWRQGQ